MMGWRGIAHVLLALSVVCLCLMNTSTTATSVRLWLKNHKDALEIMMDGLGCRYCCLIGVVIITGGCSGGGGLASLALMPVLLLPIGIRGGAALPMRLQDLKFTQSDSSKDA